jgi:hypothetical protein
MRTRSKRPPSMADRVRPPRPPEKPGRAIQPPQNRPQPSPTKYPREPSRPAVVHAARHEIKNHRCHGNEGNTVLGRLPARFDTNSGRMRTELKRAISDCGSYGPNRPWIALWLVSVDSVESIQVGLQPNRPRVADRSGCLGVAGELFAPATVMAQCEQRHAEAGTGAVQRITPHAEGVLCSIDRNDDVTPGRWLDIAH